MIKFVCQPATWFNIFEHDHLVIIEYFEEIFATKAYSPISDDEMFEWLTRSVREGNVFQFVCSQGGGVPHHTGPGTGQDVPAPPGTAWTGGYAEGLFLLKLFFGFLHEWI